MNITVVIFNVIVNVIINAIINVIINVVANVVYLVIVIRSVLGIDEGTRRSEAEMQVQTAQKASSSARLVADGEARKAKAAESILQQVGGLLQLLWLLRLAHLYYRMKVIKPCRRIN